ncbi:2-amino-4-hydroxy-6-hydroxymethyldihydropteridine diphosphokinase [Thiocapsa marina]|uniref:2-amino-4-hydroxy-6-hydroxymethyldihydropteridine pyrophosphokinase n=1 Tax=Thiocapsa marina 5811 TaxID=768671 RepID=F9UGM9_9GAMM|nr:2-amino-4-hydroxy-6-hydroxymethyldihydropteridine diphosphokinase [Thiocapsa marina]EGV16712.1 2-amino-4-hydroxy-6-hydroxymethyldihydropteridine pyrophosphokinase [Thiocapsa marina 5811]
MIPTDLSSGRLTLGVPATVWIGLGSNLQEPERQVRAALGELAALPETCLRAASRLYRTAPVGPPGQPDYINAAARLKTRLAPQALLAELHRIELAHGRLRDGTRWGPRILDLDILVYGDARLDVPGLTIPHPEIARRAFVLVPLADVASPDLAIPGVGILAELLGRCGRDGVEPLVDQAASVDLSPIGSGATGRLEERSKTNWGK